jgi:hypothetical protein
VIYNKNKKNYPPTAVYVGRGSPWGNPYRIGIDGTRDECIDLFEKNILPTLDIAALRGKNLLCHCVPKRCHAQSITKKLREQRS